MLIKQIDIENFRNFKGKHKIDFSTDEIKNVTIVIGDNNAGKTTLAQAFLWCFYGESGFKVKGLLNADLEKEMLPGQVEKIRVDVYLNHNDGNYVISRFIKIKKGNKSYSEVETQFRVGYKDSKTGETTYKNEVQSKMFVQKMMPKELAGFFFFDGEHIHSMSEELSKNKSKNFADAVRGLVGLTALINAIDNYKPSTTFNTVIGALWNEIDEKGNIKIAQYNKDIGDLENKCSLKSQRILEIQPKIEEYQKKTYHLGKEILDLTPALETKRNYEKEQSIIKEKEKLLKQTAASIFSAFSQGAMNFMGKEKVYEALKQLKTTNKLDKGIPHMHQDTIKFLLKRGYCICGCNLDVGSDAVKNLYDLIDMLPPKSLGGMFGEFTALAKARTSSADSFDGNIDTLYKNLYSVKEEINNHRIKSDELYDQLTNTDKATDMKIEKVRCESEARKLNNEVVALQQEIGGLDTKRKYLEAERDKLLLADKKNQKYTELLDYARAVHEMFSREYKEKENKVRIELEQEINKIFEEIYDGGINIRIDERYGIHVEINSLDYENMGITEIERNTAQGYAIIFAFISGIIRLKHNSDKEQMNAGVAEEVSKYPLIMDAPLSAFDKRRIANICKALPNLAEQVIIFIKDTDGEIAEEHFGNRVGSKWTLQAESYTVTNEIRR